MLWFVNSAAHPQLALMFLHNSLADPQAQAGTLGMFRAEEGLKDTRHIFFWNPAAIISHGHANAVAAVGAMSMAYSNEDIACARNCLD